MKDELLLAIATHDEQLGCFSKGLIRCHEVVTVVKNPTKQLFKKRLHFNGKFRRGLPLSADSALKCAQVNESEQTHTHTHGWKIK